MKKNLMIVFASVMFVTFTACGGGKKEEQAPAETPQVEEMKPEAAAPQTETAESGLAKFEEYGKKFVEAIQKMKAGETKGIQDYSTYSSSYQQSVADMERLKIDFTAEQTKKYEAAKKSIDEAIKTLTKKK